MIPSWLVVARREYLVRIRSVSFRVGTVAGPLLLAAIVSLPAIFHGGQPRTGYAIAVVDSSGITGGHGLRALEGAGLAQISLLDVPPDMPSDILHGLIHDGAFDGAVVISPHATGSELLLAGSIDPADDLLLRDTLREWVDRAAMRYRCELAGLDSAAVMSLTTLPSLRVSRIETGSARAVEIALFMALFLYVMLLTYGLATMRALVEEKASRIVELLLCSARPVDLLAGKICGVASVGMTQYLIWLLLALGFSRALPLGWMPTPPHGVSIGVAGACIGYFLLGYVLFAALYAMVAGMVSSTADAHHLHLPVTALVVGPIILVWLVIGAPESSLARVLSLIPVFAPVLMVARIAVGDVPVLDIGLSTAGLILANVASLWIAARIYRAGILVRGSPPTPREVYEWIRN